METWPDKRKEYMSTAEKIKQANRLIPILEAEIASGETRLIFLHLLEAQRKVLENGTTEERF